MEQTGYLQEKKAKRKRGKAAKAIILLLLLAAAAGIFFYQKRQQEKEENPNAEEAVILEENQRWLYLEIEEITGNEMQAMETSGAQEKAGGREDGGTREAVGGEKDGGTREEAGVSQTYMIPVGTDVITKLGSVTTFSRLAAGDTIHCLTQEEDGETVILKIWIEE